MEILKHLEPHEQKAVLIVKKMLDCFNSKDGAGLFAGISRYSILTERLKLAATQSRSLLEFWSRASSSLRWSITPRDQDLEILALLSPDEPAARHHLATQAHTVVMLARNLHDTAKKERREARVELKEAIADEEIQASEELFA